MACNSGGSRSATTLAFSVAPAYYQTWWFRTPYGPETQLTTALVQNSWRKRRAVVLSSAGVRHESSPGISLVTTCTFGEFG